MMNSAVTVLGSGGSFLGSSFGFDSDFSCSSCCSFYPQLTTNIAKTIRSSFLSVVVTKVLEGFEYLIFMCDDAELNRGKKL
jgi:hypothetical protein